MKINKFIEYKIKNEELCKVFSEKNKKLISNLDKYFEPVVYKANFNLLILIGKKKNIYYLYKIIFSLDNKKKLCVS